MPRNAYFYYMLDFKRDEEAKLGRSLTMSEVSGMASDSWNTMNDAERKAYRDRAKGAPPQRRESGTPKVGDRNEKWTSQGIRLSEIDRVQNESMSEEKRMHERINALLRNYTVPEGICSYPIFIMAGNYFYRFRDKFVPAELALVKFTFGGGIQQRYHAYLNPGYVELGYAADAKGHSDETHRLPIPPYALGETNYSEVFRKIRNLLNAENGFNFDGGKPFVFTYTNDHSSEDESIQMLKSFMQQMTNKESPIEVYPLSRLFYTLRSSLAAIERCQPIDSISVIKMLLSRDPYEHRSGFSCDYHEKADACAHCALSKASRWSYLLAEHLCEPLGINMVSGKHVPMDSALNSFHRSLRSLDELDSGTQSTYETYSQLSAASSRLSSLDLAGADSENESTTQQTGQAYETSSEHFTDDNLASESRSVNSLISANTGTSTNSREHMMKNLLKGKHRSVANDGLSSIDSTSEFEDDVSAIQSNCSSYSKISGITSKCSRLDMLKVLQDRRQQSIAEDSLSYADSASEYECDRKTPRSTASKNSNIRMLERLMRN